MNFYQLYTTINEGKAMNVSQDMMDFAKEVVEKLKNKKWNFNEVVHSRVVSSKYGEKNIRVETKPITKNSPSGQAYTDMNLIYLYLPNVKNPDYQPVTFEEPDGGLPVIKSRGTVGVQSVIPDYDNVDYQDCYYTIIHEMIHIFDVKLSKKPDWMKKYNVQSGEDMQTYYTSPHEQDAWMAHRARAVVDYYLKQYDGDKSRVRKELSKAPNLWSPWPADGEPESTWYKNPKIWKKYLNTLYDLLK